MNVIIVIPNVKIGLIVPGIVREKPVLIGVWITARNTGINNDNSLKKDYLIMDYRINL
jgi:hypothetical protein